MNAGKLAALDFEIARLFRAAGQQHGVEFAVEVLRAFVDADMDAVVEDRTFLLHLGDAAVDMMLFHLEVGNAVA